MATSRILQGVGCANRWNERILRGWGAEGVKWAAWVRRGVPGAARFGVGSRGAAVPGGSAVLKGFVHAVGWARGAGAALGLRSEEHTSELQSLMRISYAVFCLKTKKKK